MKGVGGLTVPGWQVILFLREGSRVEEETLEGIKVQVPPLSVPLASGFGSGSPPRGSTPYRRANQVLREVARTSYLIPGVRAETVRVIGIETMPGGELHEGGEIPPIAGD